MKWQIYHKDGSPVYQADNLTYSGEWMGDEFVTTKIKSAAPIDFQIGDYLEYRGERYTLNVIPTVQKSSRKSSNLEAFVYDGVKFFSCSDELTRCKFLDVVIDQNKAYYTKLPDFSFYALSVEDLADRIKANLDRLYKGANAWIVKVYIDKDNYYIAGSSTSSHDSVKGEKKKTITVNNLSCWEALALTNSEFDLNFIVRGRTIIIGDTGELLSRYFGYGKLNESDATRNKGLFRIDRTTEDSQQVVTRLRVYGNSTNLPTRYYANLEDSSLPNNLNCQRLMLPGFPKKSLKEWVGDDGWNGDYSNDIFDPYIDSPNVGTLGIREATIFFDGTDGEDIYPSIDKVDNPQNYVTVGSDVQDNGLFEDGASIPDFHITIADIGFDINKYLTEETATISMKDGMCGGREFTIVRCDEVSGGYNLTLQRSEDNGVYYPTKTFKIEPNNTFVVLGISLPTEFVDGASKKLLELAKEWLSKNDFVSYKYSLSVDDVFMARQHDEHVKNGEESLHDTIKAGCVIRFEDDDLDINGSITIDRIEISEGENRLPQYNITLTDEKAVGTLQRMQQQIDSIANGGGGGGYNASEIETMIRNHGSKHFLSKNNPDTAKEVITFDKGFKGSGYGQGSNGAGMWKDESGWHIQTDYLEVFNKATFREVEIQKVSHIGGQSLLTAASCKVDQFTEDGTSYKILFNAKDNDGNVITNNWAINDIAYCQTFNLEQQADGKTTNHYYKYVVKGVGTEGDYNYIILDKNNKADGSDAPLTGDSIVQLGNTTDTTRQSAIMIMGAGQAAPSILEFSGIDSFALPDPETQIKPNDNVFTGRFVVKADSTFEDGTNIKESIENISDNLSVGENLLRNSGFRGYKATLDMEGAISEETETYSPSLEYWDSVNASVVADEKPISGCAVYLRNGSIVQTLEHPIEYGEDYIISFKGQGVSANFECGGYSVSQSFLDQEDSTPRYVFKFTATENGTTFKVSSSNFCYIYDLMLEKGTVPSSAWKENSHDIPENWLDVENLKTRYLQSALRGSTEIAGGLILSNLLMLGNDKNEVTAGVNGLYADANSVSHWSGGTLEQAIYTVAKYLNNPQYQPTQEELANMAMFVVTHGGRAILNDVIARGTIYATDGVFTGEVNANKGTINTTIKIGVSEDKYITIDKEKLEIAMYNSNAEGHGENDCVMKIAYREPAEEVYIETWSQFGHISIGGGMIKVGEQLWLDGEGGLGFVNNLGCETFSIGQHNVTIDSNGFLKVVN